MLDFIFPVKKEIDISEIILKLDLKKYDKEKLIQYLQIILGNSFEIKN
jgi:hypothetical protein